MATGKSANSFREVAAQRLIHPGVPEGRTNEGISALAQEVYGITQYWHKRIERAGPKIRCYLTTNIPLDLIVKDDMFLDLGPVFEAGEADFGRTFIPGADPAKHKLRRDIEAGFCGR
jgi:Xaa-Pro dipeptidase